jgi:hypothetical protein
MHVLLAALALAGPPHYQACGPIPLGWITTSVYANGVPCSVAKHVAKECSGDEKRPCFGEFPLPYRGGLPDESQFPSAPSARPLGFQCWQSPFSGGIPPPRGRGDVHPILCERAGALVGYWI